MKVYFQTLLETAYKTSAKSKCNSLIGAQSVGVQSVEVQSIASIAPFEIHSWFMWFRITSC